MSRRTALLGLCILLLCVGAWHLGVRQGCCVAILLPVAACRPRSRESFGGLLESWLTGGAPPESLVGLLAEAPIQGPADVAAVAGFLAELADTGSPVRRARRSHRALPHVVDACMSVRDEAVCRAIEETVLPPAAVLFEISLARRSQLSQDTALALLELLLGFDEPQVVDRLVRAVRLPLAPDHLDWSRVFACLDGGHPFWPDVRDALADPLPAGFIGVAFLDAMNALALAGHLDWHPFAGSVGRRRLGYWLRSANPDEYSFAHSATTALPFLPRADRDALLPLARKHPDEEVRVEACWVAAITGDERGVEGLARWCADSMWSRQACQYLREMHRDEAIPPAAQTPEFEAVAALTSWLAHPDQLGCRPRLVEVVDQRELFWPPIQERRLIQLLRYEVVVDGTLHVGVGMVGEYTYALLEHPTDQMAIPDLYGLYCSWEKRYRQSPGDSSPIDAREGRELLSRSNPDFA